MSLQEIVFWPGAERDFVPLAPLTDRIVFCAATDCQNEIIGSLGSTSPFDDPPQNVSRTDRIQHLSWEPCRTKPSLYLHCR
jgi:hypothetical protein